MTVNWTTSSGTATSGTDYTAVAAGTFTINAGTTTGTFTVTTLSNATLESAVEAFTVNASLNAASALNARVGNGTATGYIVDANASLDPTYVVSNPTVGEAAAAGFATFSIDLSHASAVTCHAKSGAGCWSPRGAGNDYTSSMEVSTNGGWSWSAAGATSVSGAGATNALGPRADPER
ncbi:MAG: hypothetical protein IPJ25_08455 [Rhodocyclaceae bacterium]|nr:hypothetical protein [Rhodocyclaceae bacterium]